MNPLYIPPDPEVVQYPGAIITVDGISSLSSGVFAREVFELVGVHDLHREGVCPMCDEDLTPYTHLMYDGMRWTDEYPALRFTSEGLQTS